MVGKAQKLKIAKSDDIREQNHFVELKLDEGLVVK